MCGIVGLFLKDDHFNHQLGRLLTPMLVSMSDRGPDSAGFAIYGEAKAGTAKITISHAGKGKSAASYIGRLEEELNEDIVVVHHGSQVVVIVPQEALDKTLEWLNVNADELDVMSVGHRMEIYKDVGRPRDIASRFGLESMSGTHAIGHTRMATESAVVTNGAHPYSTGIDQCLVHNGSLSNHNTLRRKLMRDGISFDTENDTEVAAAYLTWRMRGGMSLGKALEASLTDLDGFYTFVVGTEYGFGVLRDPFACKHAVLAETESYVAFGTEYRALVELPGVEHARVWEPDPATVYFWERGQ